jgi:hypothetical protein
VALSSGFVSTALAILTPIVSARNKIRRMVAMAVAIRQNIKSDTLTHNKAANSPD